MRLFFTSRFPHNKVMSSTKAKSIDIPIKAPNKFSVLDRLLALPLVNLAVSLVSALYDIVKRKSPFLESVLNRVKRVFEAPRFSTFASKLKLKGNVPILSTVSETAVTLVKNWSASVMGSRELICQGKCAVDRKTRYVLHSLPGRVALWVVDRACSVMETALYLVRPDLRTLAPPVSQNGSTKQILNTLSENLEKKNEGMLFKLLVIITKPFELMVGAVQLICGYLHKVADDGPDSTGADTCLSPEKQSEIQSRRKVSPKKKLKTGFLTQLQKTVGYFGLSRLVPGLRRKFNINISGQGKALVMESPGKAAEEKKRKHDDILSDTSSSSEDEENLQTLDLDAYISDDDPDFKPAVDVIDSTDSEEYQDGDTESDIEFETSIGGTTQVRTKSSNDVGPKGDSKDTKPDASKIVHASRTKDQIETVKAKTSTKHSQVKAQSETTKTIDSTKHVQSKDQSESTKTIDPPQHAQGKDQIKAPASKPTQLSLLSPPKPGSKSTALKCSTPKDAGKENVTPPKPKSAAPATGPKKTPDSKPGALENGDKRPDQKINQLANGEKKPSAKSAQIGGKKSSNGDKK